MRGPMSLRLVVRLGLACLTTTVGLLVATHVARLAGLGVTRKVALLLRGGRAHGGAGGLALLPRGGWVTVASRVASSVLRLSRTTPLRAGLTEAGPTAAMKISELNSGSGWSAVLNRRRPKLSRLRRAVSQARSCWLIRGRYSLHRYSRRRCPLPLPLRVTLALSCRWEGGEGLEGCTTSPWGQSWSWCALLLLC